jgi:hypothetical protein
MSHVFSGEQAEESRIMRAVLVCPTEVVHRLC